MNKWVQKGAAALLAVTLLAGQAGSAGAAGGSTPQEEQLKIAVLSDTHYLSPTLIQDTADFTEHLNSDRKMFAESEAFLNALLDTIKADDPDVLLISGDLTKDGEKEGHEALADILETFEEETGAEVYITPGNHDLNNSNAKNFNTEDGVAVDAGRTSQDDYKEIYADLVYSDDSVIATFTPADGKQGGGLSYVARPKDGFTIISIDSARYSADNTDSGTDEHETSGNVGPELEAWVVEQIQAAKYRGDTVIGLQHHGMVPHFSMEPDLLPMYLVNDYERLAQVYADAGMSYIFTGHMHANDIATVTTEAGNTLYDIETGSVVTYPSPARAVTLIRTIENGTVQENMEIHTYTGVGPITFTNPVTKQEQTIEDISAYGRDHGFSIDMLSTTVNGFLHPYYAQILGAGGTKQVIDSLLTALLGDNMTLEQLIDVGLPLLLPGVDSGEEIYYDSDESGIMINKKISFITLSAVIPNAALKEAIGALLQKLDDEVLARPEKLDPIVENLVTALTSIPVSLDGETEKTLLHYANYIYQSHLGGEDSGEQPAWVTEATAKVESGELLEAVLTTVIREISDIVDQVFAGLPLQEVLGAVGWNNDTDELVPYENRTPLLRPTESGKTVFAAALVVLGWNDADDDGILELPEGTDPEVGYSVADFLDTLSRFDMDLDIHGLLTGLLLGTPADEEAGTPAEEGLLTEEIKGQINGWLLNLVASMGADSNYPEDNDTTIATQWKVLTDRTALDTAIADAEALDLSLYTDATAKAVTDALAAAKALPETAFQADMDAAVLALTDAMDALEPKPADVTDPENPDDTTGTEKPDDGDTQTSGGDSDPTDKNPQTGETVGMLPLLLLALSAGCAVLALGVKKKVRH